MRRLIFAAVLSLVGGVSTAQTSAVTPLMDAATALFEQGLYEESGQIYARVVDLDDANLTAWAGVIWSEILSGDYVSARAASESAARGPGPVTERDRYGAALILAARAKLLLASGDTLGSFLLHTQGDGSPLGEIALSPTPPAPSLDPSDTELDEWMAEWRHEHAVRDEGQFRFNRDLNDALLAYARHSPTEEILSHLSFALSRSEELGGLLRGLLSHPTLGATAHVRLAWQKSFASDDEGARVVLEDAVRLFPESYDAAVLLGDIQGETGRIGQALVTFRGLAGAHADSAAVQFGLYRALALSGDPDEAWRHYRLAEAAPGGLESVFIDRFHGCLWSMRLPGEERPPAAEFERCRSKALWADPMWGPTHREIGVIEYRRGDLAAATASLKRAVELAPDSLAYQEGLAQLYVEAGETEGALVHLRRVIDREPERGPARYMLGMLLLEDSPEAAVEHLSAAAQAYPSDASVHYHLGRALVLSDRREQAVGPLTMAGTLAPDEPDAHFQLSLNYVLLGRFDEAERAASELRRLSPEQADLIDSWIERARAQALPQSPLGEGWAYATSSNTSDFWVREEPLSVSGTSRVTWTAVTPSNGNTRAFRAIHAEQLGRSKSSRLDRILQRETFDCSGRRSKMHEAIYYDGAGTPLDSVRDDYPDWTYPAPNTVGEGLLDVVCGANGR